MSFRSRRLVPVHHLQRLRAICTYLTKRKCTRARALCRGLVGRRGLTGSRGLVGRDLVSRRDVADLVTLLNTGLAEPGKNVGVIVGVGGSHAPVVEPALGALVEAVEEVVLTVSMELALEWERELGLGNTGHDRKVNGWAPLFREWTAKPNLRPHMSLLPRLPHELTVHATSMQGAWVALSHLALRSSTVVRGAVHSDSQAEGTPISVRLTARAMRAGDWTESPARTPSATTSVSMAHTKSPNHRRRSQGHTYGEEEDPWTASLW